MPVVFITNKQQAHCLNILREFCRLADERKTLPLMWHLRIALLRDMIEDEIPFSDEDFLWLAEILRLYLSVMDDDEIDPLAEQAFVKCAGYWAILPPYYDRMRAMCTDKQLPFLGT